MAIHVEGLSYAIKEGNQQRILFNQLDLDIPDRQIVMITGASGSGKTTLLYALSGLLPSMTGKVSVDGQRLDEMNEKQLNQFRLQRIAFIFQEGNLMHFFNVEDNILMIHRMQKKQVTPEIHQKINELLEAFKLGDILGREVQSLSGGEKQRVAIIRALISESPYIFADEPTGSLDRENSIDFMESLREVIARTHATVLMVTHDLSLTHYADTQIKL